jgi:hypothetical protein
LTPQQGAEIARARNFEDGAVIPATATPKRGSRLNRNRTLD